MNWKTILAAGAMLFFIVLSHTAFSDVRPEYSGAWFNPDQSGHGFSIEVLSAERSVIFWYAYDPFGDPIFLYGDATNVGNTLQVDVYYLQGMVWGEFDPETNEMLDWGTLRITFHDCTNATLEYDSILEYESGEAFGSGEMPLVRLASIDGFKCSDYPLSGIYQGYAVENNIVYFGAGIVNESGGIGYFSSDGGLFFGQLSVDSGRFGQLTVSGSAVFFDTSNPEVADFTASGSFSPDSISADYSVPSFGDSGQLIMHKLNELTNRTVSFSDLQGSWTALNLIEGINGSVTISGNGSLSATDDFGCVYNGQITIPNFERNILGSSITVTGCIASTTFIGNGFYDSRSDELVLMGWSGEDAGIFLLTRN